MQISNVYKLHDNVYHIRTQAGFRKALKEQIRYFEITHAHTGYPAVYPCVVFFTYNEGLGLCVKTKPLSEYLNNLKELILKIQQQDIMSNAHNQPT